MTDINYCSFTKMKYSATKLLLLWKLSFLFRNMKYNITQMVFTMTYITVVIHKYEVWCNTNGFDSGNLHKEESP
jgi:hypothetical protein